MLRTAWRRAGDSRLAQSFLFAASMGSSGTIASSALSPHFGNSPICGRQQQASGIVNMSAAETDSSVLRRVAVRVGFDHPVADKPGQRTVVERAQTKKRCLALCARLSTHHLMATSPKDNDAARQQANGGKTCPRSDLLRTRPAVTPCQSENSELFA